MDLVFSPSFYSIVTFLRNIYLSIVFIRKMLCNIYINIGNLQDLKIFFQIKSLNYCLIIKMLSDFDVNSRMNMKKELCEHFQIL